MEVCDSGVADAPVALVFACAAWVESADKEAEKTLTFLDRTLNTHKANMVKESIRASFNELATFHEQRNELSTALQCYNKQEYYCSAPTHEMERAVNGARVALLSGELRSAETFVAKAEALLERDLKRASADSSGRAPDFDAVAVSKVRVLAGLVALSSKDYRRAAWNLWDADLALGDSFNDVLAARDIGMIAGLCALASYDRIQLRERVLKPRSDDARSGAPLLERPPNAESVKGFLELAPVVRDVLQDFGASRYASCLCALDELRPSLKLDLWLSRHVEALYDQIRTAAILQYFAPYSKVSMVAMAESFRTSVDELEAELARLIMSDQLQARIDSQNKLLQTRRTDERVATFQRAFEVGAQFTQDIKAMVLRANLEKRGLEIRAPRHGRAGGASEPLGAVEGGAYYDAGDGDYMGDDMGPGGGGGAGDMHP